MSTTAKRRMRNAELATALAWVLLARSLCAQPVQGSAPVGAPVQPITPQATAPGQQVTLDRVVAIVNGDLILLSDVETEKRFAAFQPFGAPRRETQPDLIERLIDRALILQQMALQPQQPISDSEVADELATLRKSIPKCAAYHCETEAGWAKFVADQGFTMDQLQQRWKLRMEVLRFIEDRFRMGIRIEQADIDNYYKNTMLPRYEQEKMTPPAEATISDRIQEILLQEQVNKLLDDWLTSLRAEGSVRILEPGEEAP